MSPEVFSQALHLPALAVAKRLNDATAGLVARCPTRLDFMVMVNPFLAASIGECQRGLDQLGAKGISVGTSWRGQFLDSPRLEPFWEYAEAKGSAVFLHPPMVPIGYQQMNRFKLEEVVGRPFDTAMTVTRMIYAGVFDRHPGLKVVLPHMGGGLPNVIGRLDFGYRLGYEGLPAGQAARCQRRPSEYLRTNLYVDTMGFSPAGVRQCIELFGVDRMLIGTDYAAVPISPAEHVEIVTTGSSLGSQRGASSTSSAPGSGEGGPSRTQSPPERTNRYHCPSLPSRSWSWPRVRRLRQARSAPWPVGRPSAAHPSARSVAAGCQLVRSASSPPRPACCQATAHRSSSRGGMPADAASAAMPRPAPSSPAARRARSASRSSDRPPSPDPVASWKARAAASAASAARSSGRRPAPGGGSTGSTAGWPGRGGGSGGAGSGASVRW
jgi:predicted TIM-barrel fold metal-dependent hydrolase